MNSRLTPRGIPAGIRQPYEYSPGPNAALLIDFDNVTMAIRSDLGKELKALLKSDVIRGKVAVQRAYADWRRYPQYIVPLTESSVDLIFAPAYGSSKKNATDLRMAIDAIELVFTRPEIGTFILMTGDSDFSSCVLKLKEYGKYVIGVGMRESSSDLLIQNCDEYYSYHSISGLVRAGEVKESQEDPWVLVRRAVQQMVKDGDVMRTDRLKQVMISLDPGFDEKKLGYSKFSRFVAEAAEKGVLRLRKGEAGQYEIVTDGEPEPREKVVERIVAEAEAGANGRRRRGRGGREERRGREVSAEAAGAEEPAEAREASEPVAAREPDLAPAEAEPVAAAPAPEAAEPEQAAAAATGERGLDWAYALLQEAVRRLTSRDGKAVRDGDVKRRMLELARDFDEGALGFSKFTRFLRQAHDAEVIDLNRTGAGNYEVSLPASGKKLPPPDLAVAPATAPEERPAPKREEPAKAPAAKREEKPAKEATAAASAAAEPVPSEPKVAAGAPPSPPAAPSASAAEPIIPVGALRGRRGTRGPVSGPPPILPGQVVAPRTTTQDGAGGGTAAPADEPARAVSAEPAASAPAEQPGVEVASQPASGAEKQTRGRRGRGGRGKRQAAEAAEVSTQPAAEAEAAPAPAAEVSEPAAPASRRSRRGRGSSAAREAKPATAPAAVAAEAHAASATPTPDTPAQERKGGRGRQGRGRQLTASTPASTPSLAERLGLPRTAPEIAAHLSGYKGVGAKTAEQLVEKFGTGIFEALESRQDEVKELLGDRRARTVLEQWSADRRSREGDAAPDATSSEAEAAKSKPQASSSGRRGGGSRRGARKKEPASST